MFIFVKSMDILKIMKIALLLLIVLIIGCTTNNSTNPQLQKVEKLLTALKDDTVSIETIIDKHFLYTNQLKQSTSQNSKLLLATYRTKLKALRTDLNHQKCEIYTWETAEQKQPAANKDLPKSAIMEQNVFVIFVQDQPKYYLKMQDKKLQSLMPMLKGDLIVGWL
jgi:hypothetical protein